MKGIPYLREEGKSDGGKTSAVLLRVWVRHARRCFFHLWGTSDAKGLRRNEKRRWRMKRKKVPSLSKWCSLEGRGGYWGIYVATEEKEGFSRV